MGVEIKACYVVKPAEATWNGILPFSELDQIGVITHIPTIYFYNNVAIENGLNPPNKIINTLQDTLSRALVSFYPLAGRLRWVDGGGGLELECNGMGVEIIEAESDQLMSDFGDFSSFKGFEDLIPRVDDSKSIEDHPLFLVQLTWFQCGGIALCMSICHAVTDGLSATHFIGEWARLARGEQLGDPPFLDRRILQANSGNTLIKEPTCVSQLEFFGPHPTLMGGGDNSEERNETVATTLTLTKSQVDNLKKAANRELECAHGKRPYGRFEVVAAHIWRCACKAREHASEQMTALCFCVDARRRMNPPLPPSYFGNAIVDVSAFSQARELMSMPLSHACRKIREANEKVTGDYVWSMIKFLEARRRLPKFSQGSIIGGIPSGDPNLAISSWLNLPVRGLDFGWGKEIFMGPATHDFDGDIMILPGYIDDGSVVVVAGLQVAHMEKFKKFFYEDINILAEGL